MLILIFTLTLSLLVSGQPQQQKQQQPASTTERPFGSISSGMNDLALRLSARIEASKTDNFVWSPYSAHSALSQILLGSGGNTLAELQGLLGISPDDTISYGGLKSNLGRGNSTLKIGNLLAIARGFKPFSAYTKQLQSRFNSEIMELDVTDDITGSINKVNKFISDATAGLIEKVVNKDQVDALTRIILVNAIYFKALWKNSFDKTASFNNSFRGPSGNTNATYMSRKMEVRGLSAGNYDLLELPYTDTSKAMILALPKEGVSTENIIQNLPTDFLMNKLRSTTPQEYSVTIPKFQLHDRIFLKSLLQREGVGSLFSQSADLSAISAQPLSVTDAVQDSVIEVSEEGTEAAAATVAIIGLRTVQRTKQFFADRPFAFFVYDYEQNIPLFIGKVVDPSASGSVAIRSAAPLLDTESPQVEGKDIIDRQEVEDRDAMRLCKKHMTDYPNASNNVKLCEMATRERNFEWLSMYKKSCDLSQDLISSFKRHKCEASWCKYANLNKADWANTVERLCRSSPAGKTRECRENENKLNALNGLNC